MWKLIATFVKRRESEDLKLNFSSIEMCLGQSVREYISYFINIISLIYRKTQRKKSSVTCRQRWFKIFSTECNRTNHGIIIFEDSHTMISDVIRRCVALAVQAIRIHLFHH